MEEIKMNYRQQMCYDRIAAFVEVQEAYGVGYISEDDPHPVSLLAVSYTGYYGFEAVVLEDTGDIYLIEIRWIEQPAGFYEPPEFFVEIVQSEKIGHYNEVHNVSE